MTTKNYTSWRERLWMEELLNTISHGVGAIASIIGFVYLIIFASYSNKDWALFSSIFYGISLMAAYISSTFYHAVSNIELKRKLLSVDQACIFLLIAGTYTPFLLISLGGIQGWSIFAIQWGTALFGILLKHYNKEKFDKIALFIYIIMGWFAIFYIHDLYIILPSMAFNFMVGGGIAYSVGVIFYLLDAKVHYSHFVWHLFVILGSSMHYFVIFNYLL